MSYFILKPPSFSSDGSRLQTLAVSCLKLLRKVKEKAAEK